MKNGWYFNLSNNWSHIFTFFVDDNFIRYYNAGSMMQYPGRLNLDRNSNPAANCSNELRFFVEKDSSEFYPHNEAFSGQVVTLEFVAKNKLSSYPDSAGDVFLDLNEIAGIVKSLIEFSKSGKTIKQDEAGLLVELLRAINSPEDRAEAIDILTRAFTV